MPLARVVQGEISVATEGWRVPLDYFQGQEVELSTADFKRLRDAGAVVAAGDYEEPEDEDVAEVPEEAEEDQAKAEYFGMSHAELDKLAKKRKITFPAKAKREDKAAALAAFDTEEG